MTKRLALMSLIAAGAASAVIAAGSSHPAAAQSPAGDLTTTAKPTFFHSTDLGRHGPSAGDVNTFGGKLTGPDLKGHYQAACVNVSRTNQECTETLFTAAGEITAQAAYGKGSTAITPITGGSGNYGGARGTIAEQEVSNGRQVHLVVHLLR
jgi:hypothetical protein